MGGIFSPAKPAPVVAAPPAPTQDSAAEAAKTAAADAAKRQGRSANQTSDQSLLNQEDSGDDQFSVRRKLLGN